MSKLPTAFVDSEDSQLVADAKKEVPEDQDYSYTERDVILYNLGVGATEQELQWTYEGHEEFGALPTFGVIPQLAASSGIPLGWLPNYNPAKLLHGEQYLSIKGSIPTEATLVNETRLLEVLDKGKAASVTTLVQTRDKRTGQLLLENQSTLFIRGAGGFGGKRIGTGTFGRTRLRLSVSSPVFIDRGAATATNVPPKRAPDVVMEEKTSFTQAALYRLVHSRSSPHLRHSLTRVPMPQPMHRISLSGDYNPLHISPEFASMGGFDKPILHGLCFMGIAGKHVLKSYGPYKDIKVRFAGVVYPGETLVTEMWKEGDKVIFTAKIKERGTTVLTSAGVTLADEDKPKL
ncbi:hydroxysteroid dehydrogenase [Chiua virens]|nr:hydroxysteroid dehydrogenase [Chiua virens]